MDIFDTANPISLTSSPQGILPPTLEGGPSRTSSSSPGDSSTNASFYLASPHDPTTSNHFTPSSAPELSRLYLVDSTSPFKGYQNTNAGSETFWGSSLDYTSSRACTGTRSRADFDSSNRLDIAPIEPGVSPKVLFQADQSDPPHSLNGYHDRAKYVLSPSSMESREHQLLRRASPLASTWSDYRFSQDIAPTKIKSQDDVLPPLSTLFFDPSHSLSAYDHFNTDNSPPSNPHIPSELHSIDMHGEALEPMGRSHRPPNSIYCQPESTSGEGLQGRLNPKREPHAGLPSISATGHVGLGFPHHGALVTYTDDASSKETQHLRRRCFNCRAIEPPSWRRSALNHGKIVCNRCGLYERTHLRARPLRIGELPGGPTAPKSRKGSKASVTNDFPSGKRIIPKNGHNSTARRGSMTSTTSSSSTNGPGDYTPLSPSSPFDFPAPAQLQPTLGLDLPQNAAPSRHSYGRRKSSAPVSWDFTA